MRRILALAFIALALAVPARSQQTFTNLDFEQAQVVPNDPFGFLDWALAVPGWGHSSGSATEFVYYEHTHLGTTQYFLLVDAVSWPTSLLAGSYSLAFASGFQEPNTPSPWVHAYISQTGAIPVDARYLRLLATGPFGVLVGGVPIPMRALGGNTYIGDISAFSGATTELRIVNTSLAFHDPVVADNIAFLPIPEPETGAMLLAGLAALAVWRHGPRCWRATARWNV